MEGFTCSDTSSDPSTRGEKSAKANTNNILHRQTTDNDGVPDSAGAVLQNFQFDYNFRSKK